MYETKVFQTNIVLNPGASSDMPQEELKVESPVEVRKKSIEF